MKIIAVSDSHGHYDALRRVADAHGDAELFIHLGDGAAEAARLKEQRPAINLLAVRGNCDEGSQLPLEGVTVVGGKRIYYTHGHLLSVKYTEKGLLEAADKNIADIVLFGHTHEPFCQCLDGRWILNPGSLVYTKLGKLAFSIINIDDGEFYCYNTLVGIRSMK